MKRRSMSSVAAAPVAFTDAKRKRLDNAVAQIEKSFGKGSLMRLGDEGAVKEIEAISTGSLALDVALGIGGLSTGRLVAFYGPELSGQTNLALHVLAVAQKEGVVCRFGDDAHAFAPAYAHKTGSARRKLLLPNTDTPEPKR